MEAGAQVHPREAVQHLIRARRATAGADERVGRESVTRGQRAASGGGHGDRTLVMVRSRSA